MVAGGAVSMSKRRGLSLEEKRQRIMDIFFEKKEFFQLKEVEKIASKEKGINAMVVKDILQGLVDDGMVESDRIGTSNYYWAFPSKALNTRRCKIEALEKQVQSMEKQSKVLEDSLRQAQEGREDTNERSILIEKLEAQKKEKGSLMTELEQHKSCDPDVLRDITQQTKSAIEAANRWTENIFTVKSWCKNKFNIDEDTLNKQFSIPDDLDYIS